MQPLVEESQSTPSWFTLLTSLSDIRLLTPLSCSQIPRADPPLMVQRVTMYGADPWSKWITSEPPTRGFEGPKFRRVMPSTWSIDELENWIPLLPVRFPPSMIPPDMQTWDGVVASDIAELAPVELLI